MLDKNPPVGWKKWERFEDAYIDNTGMNILFITIENGKYIVRLLGEEPVKDKNLRGFVPANKKSFQNKEEAWGYARSLMLNVVSTTRIKKKHR